MGKNRRAFRPERSGGKAVADSVSQRGGRGCLTWGSALDLTYMWSSVRISLSVAGVLATALSLGAQTPAAASGPAGTPSANTAAAITPAKPATVQVASQGKDLKVDVPDQTPLSTVMAAVCKQQKIKCTGAESLGSFRGPAMSVEGPLRQVVSKLLEGTDVNYELARTAQGTPSEITFLGHAPRGTAAVPTASAPEPATQPTFMHSRAYPGGPPRSQPPDAPQPPTTPAPSDNNASGTPASPPQAALDPQAEALRSQKAAAEMFTGSGNTAPAQYQPFPDSHGQPIPLTDVKPTALPFPDQFGNPIPLKQPTGGSPFPMGTSKNTTDGKQP